MTSPPRRMQKRKLNGNETGSSKRMCGSGSSGPPPPPGPSGPPPPPEIIEGERGDFICAAMALFGVCVLNASMDVVEFVRLPRAVR